jgi:hypothetical protein
MNHKIISYILFTSFVFGQTLSVKDLTDKISPIGIAPSPQSGYGIGDDQLAQPDDVELLSDGSMIISDVDNNRIQYFSKDGKLLKSITAHDIGLTDIEIIPTGISKDAQGFIYISLEGAGVVARFTPNLELDQLIGQKCAISAKDYYKYKHENCLISPQGLIVNSNGDVYVIDMAQKVFKVGDQRNFGFKKFKKITKKNKVTYHYDRKFASSQEITKVMRKSEGMAIDEKRGLLLIAEEKPSKSQFGNSKKKRYVAAFDLETGEFLNSLYGVTRENEVIIDGYFYDSVEGLAILDDNLFIVDEKEGKVYIFNIESGNCLGSIGKKAYYYCDDKSDCVIEGVNYNEQSIIANIAIPYTLNDWQKNEIASPDGVSVIKLDNGTKRLALVDQWNSRIMIYDLDDILNEF